MLQRTTFFSQGARLAASLWTKSATAERRPAVVVTGSWTTVKEQMPANYAPLLAEAGFVAMTFDFLGFGESEGGPREVESARSKAEDFRNAFAYLRSHPAVDADRIGALTICASSGYVALASIGEPHVKSVAMVAPWLHNATIVRDVYGGDTGVRARIAEALAAREKYARTGEVDYVRGASSSDTSAAMYFPGDALDYYLNPNRGGIPQWGDRFATMAWKEWLEFDPIALAPEVQTPIRIITSEQSATPGGARQFAAGLRSPHDVIWTQGTQFDFYDNPATVSVAAAHAIDHLRSTLV